MAGLSVYREPPVPTGQSSGRVPASNCRWCRFSSSSGHCEHPVVGNPFWGKEPDTWKVARCQMSNPRGECPHWSPSWWTRLLRLIGGRAPAMVDPRVWEDGPSRSGTSDKELWRFVKRD